MNPIARIHTPFPTKFGIPRQSGLIPSLPAEIVFEKEFRNPDAVRGLDDFSHIWLLWEFSEAKRSTWSATVRPPRLGGNQRMGVFATRSPFRPNPIGLSCVRLQKIDFSGERGPVLHVLGADLMDQTPIYDIKPYLPAFDSQPQASGGFTEALAEKPLHIECSPALLEKIPQEKRELLWSVLSQDPRPSYQHDKTRIYGLEFDNMEIRFSIDGLRLIIHEIWHRGQAHE